MLPTYLKNLIQKNDPDITKIDLNNLGLNDTHAIELYNLLSKNNYITYLDLSYNNLSVQTCELLAKMSNIKILNLSQNNIGNEGLIKFSDNYNTTNLKKLILYNNDITIQCMDSLKKLCHQGIKINIIKS